MDYFPRKRLVGDSFQWCGPTDDGATLLEAMAIRSSERRQKFLDQFLLWLVVEQGEDGTLRVVR